MTAGPRKRSHRIRLTAQLKLQPARHNAILEVAADRPGSRPSLLGQAIALLAPVTFPVRSPCFGGNFSCDPRYCLTVVGLLSYMVVTGGWQWGSVVTSSNCESVGVSPPGASAPAVVVERAAHRPFLKRSSPGIAPAEWNALRQATDVSRNIFPHS